MRASLCQIAVGALALLLFAASGLADTATAPGSDTLAPGKKAYVEGDYERAIQEFEKVVRRNQRDSNAYLWLARALGRKAESVSRFVAAFIVGDVRHNFERAVQLDPRNVEARADLLEFYLSAPGVFGGGLDKARAQAEAIRQLNPAEGHWAAARIAEKQKDYAHAEQELLAALAADPKPGRYREMGHFYRRRGRWEDMEAAYRKAGDPPARYDLAEVYLQHGMKLEEAAQLLESFLAAPPPPLGEEPTHAGGHLLLGKAYARLGRKQEAEREFRAALQENPALKAAREELEKLKKK